MVDKCPSIDKGTAYMQDEDLKAFLPYSREYVLFIDTVKGRTVEVHPDLIKQIYDALSTTKNEEEDG